MPRKSARIQGKSKQEQQAGPQSKKRKTDESDTQAMACTSRRQKYSIKTNKMVVESMVVSSCSIEDAETCLTPPKVTAAEGGDHCLTPPPSANRYRFQNIFTTPESERDCPLPILPWGSREEVWEDLLAKEQKYRRNPDMFSRHPDLEPRMRAILLDWMMEVCEVYMVHRETYHIAMDYVDRYLGKSEGVEKSQLQLIGITAVHIAAKNEEIYPPKLDQLAYVTDEACSVEDIKAMELIMLQGLDWLLQPMTALGWVRLYLQMATRPNFHGADDSFIFPQFSAYDYIQICRLLDLATLDVECLKFPNNYVAASAFYLLSWGDCALYVSRLTLADIQPCVQWMTCFKYALPLMPETPLKHNNRIRPEDVHLIQRHTTTMDMFDQVIQSQSYEPMRLPVTVSPQPPAAHTLPPYALDLTPPLDEEIGTAQASSSRGLPPSSPHLDTSAMYALPLDSDCEDPWSES